MSTDHNLPQNSADVNGGTAISLMGYIGKSARIFMQDRSCTELRALKVPKRATVSGYYTDAEQLALSAVGLDGRCNVYVTLNPVDPVLMSRAYNRVDDFVRHTTKDEHIVRLCYLLVDFDPVRPEGISSNDTQHEDARQRATAFRAFIYGKFGKDTLLADSGNGAHVIPRVDLPNTPENVDLLRRALLGIKARFDDDAIEVDRTTFNPSRITKLYGTMAVKGDSTPERPHRRSMLHHVPTDWQPLTVDELEQLAALAGNVARTENRRIQGGGISSNVASLIARHGIEVRNHRIETDGREIWDIVCPWHDEHTSHSGMRETSLSVDADGQGCFHCFHAHCAGRRFDDVLRFYESRSTNTASAAIASIAELWEVTEYNPEQAHLRLLEHTDLGNAGLFARMHGERARYVLGESRWRVYNGRYWEEGDNGSIQRLAHRTVEHIALSAIRATSDDARRRLIAHAGKSASARGISNMLEVAATLEELGISKSRLDSDKWLLNVTNGTLDLRTGTLREFRRDDYITRSLTVPYLADATSPTFERVLCDVLPDDDTRRFFWLAAATALTGDVSEQLLFVLRGEGENGKTTVMEALLNVLGDYAMQATSDLLLTKGRDEHPTQLTDMEGKRLVCMAENEKDKLLAVSLMKLLTGGESVRARRMRQDYYQFAPTHKFFLLCNYLPVIRAVDHGTWRRIRVIPFLRQISAGEKDKGLKEKLEAEAPGILAWMVRGCLEWQKHGLRESALMVEEGKAYRKSSDTVQSFIEDACETGDTTFTVGRRPLHQEYLRWCKQQHEKPMLETPFGLRMKAIGFSSRRVRGTHVYEGIRVLSTVEQFAEPIAWSRAADN